MKLIKGLFIIIASIVVLTGCNAVDVYKGEEPEDPKLKEAISGFFKQYNDIRTWEYATDDFIKQEYADSSKDSSGEKSIEEMKQLYYELNKDRVEVMDFYVDKITVENENTVLIEATRKLANDVEDVVVYSFVKENEEWKVNLRVR